VRYRKDGIEVVLIGHAGHPEVEGTMGQARDGVYLVEKPQDVERLTVRDPARLAYVTQTTLSMDDTARVVDALRARFPQVHVPRRDDICYATQNRQDAVKVLAAQCDLMLVVGSRNSSNSNRLREIAEKSGVPAYLIDGPDDIDRHWLAGCKVIGVTAGASAPERLVQLVVARLRSWGAEEAEEFAGRRENVVFTLPKPLRAPPVES